MKHIFGICLAISVAVAGAAAQQQSVTLTGTILGKPKVREDASVVYVKLKLRFTLRSSMDRPAIFVTEDDSVCSVSGIALFSQSDPQAKMYGPKGRPMFGWGGRQSNPGDEYRTKLRSELEVDPPPPNMTTTLTRDETVVFTRTQTLIVNKTEDPSLGIESWATLVNSSPLDLYLSCGTFPENLDGQTEDVGSFGSALRVRWEQYGNLWLDDLETAPIQLDLRGLKMLKR